MIMLHNNQLQNQCFRPSLHHRSHSNTPLHPSPNPTHHNPFLTRSKLKRSQSTDSNTHPKVNSSWQKHENEAHNWMSNHFLDIKQKFKEIIKHKNSQIKHYQPNTRKNSVHSRIKQRNLSVICQSGISAEGKKGMENLGLRPFKNKKLIDLKKGRLFRGTQRSNCNERIVRIEGEREFEQLLQSPLQLDVSDDEVGQSYLKSQEAALQKIRQQQTIKTEKRTIQSIKFNKYRSEIKTTHIPISLLIDEQPSRVKIDPIKGIEEVSKNIIERQLHLGLKRSSLSRRISNRQVVEEVRPRGSYGVIFQI